MTFRFSFFVLFLSTCLTWSACATLVRIEIAREPVRRGILWHFRCKNGFMLAFPGTQAKNMRATSLAVRVHEDAITLNGKPCFRKTKWRQLRGADLVVLKPIVGRIAFEKNEYVGFFEITVSDGFVHVINVIDLEEYVASVLRSEGWPGWPLEFYKVQAVVSRSYAVVKMQQAKKRKRLYHIRNTNVHQTYNGWHDSTVLRQAVEQTRGLVLGYDGEPVEACFDACCGGIVPKKMSGWDFVKAPHLARPYACTYCRSCRLYRWQATYPLAELSAIVRREFPHVGTVRDIKITRKDKAGIVQELTVRGSHSTVTITGKQWYLMLKEAKSFCFTVQKKGKFIILNGRGYGHQIGLCQWGAREMIRQHHNYKAILRYYYPRTVLMNQTERRRKGSAKKE